MTKSPQGLAKKIEQNQLTDSAAGILPLSHIAIIMDGNRRWAESRHLPKMMGHKEGVKTLKKIVRHAGKRDLKYLTVYAFSSENWQRSQDEVDYLLELFTNVLKGELDDLCKNNVRLRFLGQLSSMPPNLRKSMEKSMERTSTNTGLCLQVAINYGARLEITDAVKAIAEEVAAGRLKPENIDENLISKHLYTRDLPDPELLIRTGGEQRLSNYLLWQCAYTELYVTPTLWPDFSEEDFESAVSEFAQRNRRYGG